MTKLSNSKLVSFINDKYVKCLEDEKTFMPLRKKMFSLEKRVTNYITFINRLNIIKTMLCPERLSF